MPASDQGVLSGRYNLIPRTLVFLTRGDEVLLLKGAPHKRLWANLYNGIGGHIERGEDILSAARRELAEESGIVNTRMWLCGVVTIDAGPDAGICIFVHKGEVLQGEPIPSPEGTLEWLPQDKIYELPLVEDLHSLLPRVLGMQPGDPPFSAHYHYDEDQRMVIRFAN